MLRRPGAAYWVAAARPSTAKWGTALLSMTRFSQFAEILLYPERRNVVRKSFLNKIEHNTGASSSFL